VEKILFRRLSVFVGGFTLEAAEAVCSGGDVEEVLEPLSHLLDKSLVVARGEHGARRYRLLETIRQYARGRLEGSGEVKIVRRVHALYYLQFAEESEPGINGPERGLFLRRLEAEHGNLRAALDESSGGDVGLRLAGALWWYWFHRGYRDEGRGWLGAALGRPRPVPTPARAKALCGAGWLSFVQGDHEAGRSYLEESVTVAREADDDVSLAYALGFLAVLRAHQGDPAPALAEEGVRLFRSTGERWGLGIALTNAGISAEALSEYALANPFFEESAAIFRDLGDDWALSLPLRHLGIVASRQQDYARAEALYKESLALCRDLGEGWLISMCLEELAGAACWQGEYPRAARLWGAGETMREKLGAGLRSLYRAEYDRGVATARSGMGEGAYAAAWKEGTALTPDEAVACALGEEPDETALPAGLTGREAEVLRLVAAGLTNTQVAERLYLSPTTISAHLRTIYGKPGVNSRAAATRFAADHSLL
jgi:DNA-binding CsgD family transcriptional regulator/tetratricopeptide (TPR) repeat protein